LREPFGRTLPVTTGAQSRTRPPNDEDSSDEFSANGSTDGTIRRETILFPAAGCPVSCSVMNPRYPGSVSKILRPGGRPRHRTRVRRR
jgi:hypothetical protein